MKQQMRASLLVLLTSSGMVAITLAFVLLRWQTPSDGTRLARYGVQAGGKVGVTVTPWLESTNPLRADDTILAVAGTDLETWARRLVASSTPHPAWQFGQTLVYTVLRGDQSVEIPVTLTRYPLSEVMAQGWGVLVFALINLGVVAFVFVRRPKVPAARVLLLMGASILASSMWVFGPQISDLFVPAGFWLFQFTCSLGYFLIWITLLHLTLVFPQPQPILRRHGWLIPSIYIVPFIVILLFLLILARQTQATLDFLAQVDGSEQIVIPAYLLLTVIAAINGYRSVADPIGRRQVRLVLSVLYVPIGFYLTGNLLPNFLLGYPLFDDNVVSVTALVFPLALAIAVLRYRLFNIDVLIKRTLLYGSLTAGIASLYVLVVGAMGLALQTRGNLAAVLLTALLIAMVIRPLHSRVQRGVDHLMPDSGPPSPTSQPYHAADLLQSGEKSHIAAITRPRATLPKQLAWSLALVAILIMVVGFGMNVVYVLATRDYRQILSHQSLVPISTVIYAMIGALVVSRHPRNPLGWIFGVVSLFYGLNALSIGYSLYASTFLNINSPPGLQLADWLNTWVWIPEILLPTTFVFLLFPNGRLLSPRWSLVAWPVALGLVAVVAGIAFHPGPLDSLGAAGSNPFGIAAAGNLLEIIVNLGYVLISIGLIGSLGSLAIRFRRSGGIERQQMKWLVYAAGLMLFALVLGAVVGMIWPDSPAVSELSIALTSLVILGIALATSIAILRHRLYDIDLIINHTLVYGTLSAGVVGIYALVVGALGTLFQARGSWITALVATGLVAVLFQPFRERLQRWVNRLIYGQRDEPFEVLARLGQQLEGILAPQMVYATIVETVSRTLKLPYAAINLDHGDGHSIAAEYGKPSPQPVVFPLVYQGGALGQLLVARRAPNEAFTEVEERLLRNIARQAGAAVHAVQLTEDLQRSRQRLVTAREEERRRLRRDLHDGLGPQLATLTLKIDAAGNLIDQNPAAAQELLNQLKEETKSALGDIRRIAYDLRPPTLDELGLIPALREHVTSLNQQEGLQILVQAPENSPPLPAAVEVAAYRIAMEGLTNVIHHAHASKCLLRINVNQHLEVEICDDGRGFSTDIRSGVGLSSMRERVAELGGAFMIDQGPKGGTRLLAKLPLDNVSFQSSGKG